MIYMMCKFSHGAKRVIYEFVNEISKRMNELGFKCSAERKDEILLNIKTLFELRSIKIAKKRGSNFVCEADAIEALGNVAPRKFLRTFLGEPYTFKQAELQKVKYFNLLKKKLESSKGLTLLDAGCGWGRQLIEYRKRGLEGEFVALDIDKDAIKLGNRMDSSIHFLVADIRKMPFRSCIFDAAISISVINLLRARDVKVMVSEFHRVLEPQGFLYIYGFFIKNYFLTYVMNFLSRTPFKTLVGGDFNFYTSKQLHKLLSKKGFEKIQMERSPLRIISCSFGNNEIFVATKSRHDKNFTQPSTLC